MKGFLGVSSITPSILQPINENFNAAYCDIPKMTTGYDMIYARSGVVLKNSVEFLFSTGDIICNNDAVKFITVPDTLMYSSDIEINQSLRSEDFQLDQNASLLFTNYFYVLNKEGADSLLNENDIVNFKVELVNSITNTVVGTFDNITFTKENLQDYENISYEVDCSDIIPGTYYLRLVLAVTGNAEYVMINTWNDPSSVLKRTYNSITFAGSEVPSSYGISQNYPNPFNPWTVIEYQLPISGVVTLMASGTYIYRLKIRYMMFWVVRLLLWLMKKKQLVNILLTLMALTFVSTRKMLLIK